MFFNLTLLRWHHDSSNSSIFKFLIQIHVFFSSIQIREKKNLFSPYFFSFIFFLSTFLSTKFSKDQTEPPTTLAKNFIYINGKVMSFTFNERSLNILIFKMSYLFIYFNLRMRSLGFYEKIGVPWEIVMVPIFALLMIISQCLAKPNHYLKSHFGTHT